MNRRRFIWLLGGVTAAWPIAARAQQRERMRRIGIFNDLASNDPVAIDRLAAFLQGLQQLGWTVGNNLRIDYRWAGGDPNVVRKYVTELVAIGPDVIVSLGGIAFGVGGLHQETRSIPIVFASVLDPVGTGLVASLARPGGNVTGFANLEFGTSVKWLELLKQIAPHVRRVAVIRAPTISGGAQFGAMQGAASPFGMELYPIDATRTDVIETALAAFAREPNGGLIVTGTAFANARRELIVGLADRHRLPAVYSGRPYVAAGGLLSYGVVDSDLYRGVAGYVDRILKGEKPADLPVQAPTKYELVINLKTAKALGLDIPPTVIARADEVIE
jgi:putative ABC transport system substrate-binding protein